MKRTWIVVVVVGVVIVLGIPVLNLITGTPHNPLMQIEPADALSAGTVATLSQKCVPCHTSEPHEPFYAKLPIAGTMIRKDIADGSARIDYVEVFSSSPHGTPTEVELARTEYVIRENEMPPARYLLMHWNHGVSPAERARILAWVGGERLIHYPVAELPPDVQEQALRPLVAAAGEDPRKVALGRALFHDPRLSGDDTVSCASCHDLSRGGTDRQQFSTGVGGAVGGINSPTVFNAGLQFRQFWDGRARSLEEQADGPVNNPIEMASNWEQVIGKLSHDRSFTKAFRAVYPDGYDKGNVIDAIAAFERTLVTTDSAFDRYLLGDDEALSQSQKRGYALFADYGCGTCHVGQAMGGTSFEKMGLGQAYFTAERAERDADRGRFNVTGDEADRHKFKVPTLRNVAVTYPYLHDGSTSDLEEVVRIMARHQSGREMPDRDVRLVAGFLESLTGEYEGRRLE